MTKPTSTRHTAEPFAEDPPPPPKNAMALPLATLPPSFAPNQMFFKAPAGILIRLARLIEGKPSLLRRHGLPEEPRYLLRCPDNALLDLAVYTEERNSCLQLIAYEAVGNGGSYGGVAIPHERVIASLQPLFDRYAYIVEDPPPVQDTEYFGV